MPTEVERAWFAGLFEGEGSISFPRKSPSLSVAMTDEDVVRRAQAIVGAGNVTGPYLPPKLQGGYHKPVWRWSVGGSKAAAVLLWIYPYLGIRRRERIEEVVGAWMDLPFAGRGSHQKFKTHCPQGHPYDGDNLISGVTKWGGVSRRCLTCKKAKDAARRPRKRVA